MCFPEEELRSRGGSRWIEMTRFVSPRSFAAPAWLKPPSLMEAPLGACLVGRTLPISECAGTLSAV